MRRWLLLASILPALGWARAITFDWDVPENQPDGVTYELHVNGNAQTGIVAHPYPWPTDIPDGTLVNARVRAVAPDGFDCSQQTGPCPKSDWATLAQTLPAAQPSPRVNAIAYPAGITMAAPTFVAQYATAFNSSASPKTAMSAVSISSGDVLVGVGAHENEKGSALAITEDGASSWIVVQGNQLTDFCETRGWTYTASANESLTVTFIKSVDYFGGNVIRFSGSSGVGASAISSSTSGSPSVAITTTQDNSAIVVIVADWNAVSGTQTFTSNGGAGSPTNLTGYAGDGAHYGVAIAYYPDAGTAGSKTVGMSAPAGQKWTIIAIEVKGSASGNASITLSGGQSVAGVGVLTLSGAALKSISGPSGAGAVGSIVVGGGATATPAGLLSAGGAGTLGGAGTANTTPPGIATSGLVGSLSLSGGAGQLLSGLLGSGGAGLLNAQGGAAITSIGAAAAGAAGVLSLSAGANVTPIGIYITGLVGNVFASAGGNVNVSLSGLVAVGNAGALALSGGAQQTIAGLAATVGIGAATAHGGGTAAFPGVASTGTAGAVSLSATALLNLLGASGAGTAGLLALAADAAVTLTGIGANGQVGTITVSAGATASITLSGVASIGQVGTVTLSADAIALLTGIQALGQAGFLRLVELITPAGRLLLVESEGRLLLIEPEDRLLSIQSDGSNLNIS